MSECIKCYKKNELVIDYLILFICLVLNIIFNNFLFNECNIKFYLSKVGILFLLLVISGLGKYKLSKNEITIKDISIYNLLIPSFSFIFVKLIADLIVKYIFKKTCVPFRKDEKKYKKAIYYISIIVFTILLNIFTNYFLKKIK